ncbi:MAG TPA: hypothetical protein VFX30_06185 [bacterium]|nr:hypothetical protein [bacterium]
MKKTFLRLLSGFLCSFLFASAFAGPPEKPRDERLRAGEVWTDGGYLKKGVWGEMEGVVEAPPEVVWRLFIQANDWNGYHLPEMIDCRAVDEAILAQAKDTKKVDVFYKAMGDRTVDPVADRAKGSTWRNYTFQFFNLPWPVSDRWYIIENFADETNSAEGVYKTRWESRAGNIRSLTGELHLQPFEGDKSRTLLRYRVDTDPGASIPKFLLKWGVKKSLPAAMRVIRRESIRLKNKS